MTYRFWENQFLKVKGIPSELLQPFCCVLIDYRWHGLHFDWSEDKLRGRGVHWSVVLDETGADVHHP